mmetsp:Transcript_41197/g.29702  ORF Transcript_41197/g.29702 Transcript_41197/m.29702 type:complete len:127 (+) Transcript_41197:43-423(+)|eukprot:CAMPEP_0116870654 /NCGR_PEP_ID=MMETSP0463-20121206/649_1 /TAXON_ID=181622 /ORGANISM="Strombidinopsis sp, Strain SopsisLIS2011" /LENGTH=126 /DNA_ID=CAMNT_0004507581 /DNA_START=32 /DNA_END=412 /DNA_ORIENTATION=+
MTSSMDIYLTYLKKHMDDFATWPAEQQANAIKDQQDPSHEVNHDKFFKEADKNDDGLLNEEEYGIYIDLWGKLMVEKFGESFPFNHALHLEGYNPLRVSGKDGISQEDFAQVKQWAQAAVAQMQSN